MSEQDGGDDVVGPAPSLNRRLVAPNIAWVMGDKVIRLAVLVTIGAWVARHLGPEGFGVLNYALAAAGLVGAVCSAGLPKIVVREILDRPQEARSILSSAFAIQLSLGLLGWGATVAVVALSLPGNTTAIATATIIGAVVPLRAAEVVKYWLESRIQMKYAVWGETSAVLAGNAGRLILLLAGSGVVGFAWLITLEAGLTALALAIVALSLRTTSTPGTCRPSLAVCGRLLRQSWSLALSGIAAIIYLRVDQVMIGSMMDPQAVGTYSVAVQLITTMYFIPYVVSNSVFPLIYRHRETDPERYALGLKRLFTQLVWFGVLLGAVTAASSGWIIAVLYGPDYSDTIALIRVHSCGLPFIFLSAAAGAWFIAEGRQHLLLVKTVLGAALNIALNAVLIGPMGGIGAAMASVITLAFIALLSNALNRGTWRLMAWQTEAILMPWRYLGGWRSDTER